MGALANEFCMVRVRLFASIRAWLLPGWLCGRGVEDFEFFFLVEFSVRGKADRFAIELEMEKVAGMDWFAFKLANIAGAGEGVGCA